MKFIPANEKAQQLRRHRRLATGLFVLMVILYIGISWLQHQYAADWTGYVKAFSEAAMVGALADWFAVTALFHHPLGLKIPHTNLIEKSKEKIGDNLGNFVVDNFLNPQNIRPYILRINVSSYAAGWLSKAVNKQILLSEVSRLLQDILLKMEDKTVTSFLARKGEELIAGIEVNKMVANALRYFLEKKEHQQLVTLLATKIKDYISSNKVIVQERVKSESFFFIPKFVDNKLAEKITLGLMKYFEEIAQEPEHKIRQEIDAQLLQFIAELPSSTRWDQTFRELKSSLLSPVQLEQYAASAWSSLKETIITELSDDKSSMMQYFGRMLTEISDNLQHDVHMRERIDRWVRWTAYKYILRNTDKVATLISSTIGNWQGKELSEKLELEVGKDLQFIRINGTLVGGLVGLLIYTITKILEGL